MLVLSRKLGEKIVIGDNIVVTVVKSLFETFAAGEDLRGALVRFSGVLKRMRLGRLYMSMTLARFENGRLTLTAAGMPPALDRRRVMPSPLPRSLDEFHCRRPAVALMTEPPLRVASGELLVVHRHLELAHLKPGALQLRFQLLLLTQHALS